MSHATSGQTVRIHYTGKLENGSTFDSSAGREPLEFELGSGQVISGLDQALEGMAVGETKTVTIQPDEAYGARRDDLIGSVPNSALPDDLEPAVGMQLQSQAADGQITRLVVTEVAADSITVDANHPLAGEVLVFEVELVAIA
jgi:peptidylprolyl isomerase